MFFVNKRSLECHLNLYCQRAASSSALSRLKDQDEPLSKKIGIQIRKVYKTQSDSVTESNDSGVVVTRSPIKLKLVGNPEFQSDAVEGEKATVNNVNKLSIHTSIRYLNSEGPMSIARINREMHTFCNFQKFTCKLCRQRFSSTTSLKRHSASHLSWTRYVCALCGLREFNNFKIRKHLMLDHSITPAKVSYHFKKAHYFNAPFKDDIMKHVPPAIERSYFSSPSRIEPKLSDIKMEQDQVVDDLGDREQEVQAQSEAPLLQLLAQNSEQVVPETQSLPTSPKAPQTLTLKLKRIQLDSPDISKHKVQQEKVKILNKLKSKSLDSIIKSITVSSSSRIQHTLSEQPVHAAASKKLPEASGLSSRQRRVIRPPAKRKFPDSPETFTGGQAKKQALEIQDISLPFNDKPTSKKTLPSNSTTESKIMRSSGRKLKISLPGLMKRPDSNGYQSKISQQEALDKTKDGGTLSMERKTVTPDVHSGDAEGGDTTNVLAIMKVIFDNTTNH